MAAPARFPSQVALRMLAIIDANKPALIGVDAQTFYGDQDKLPTSPTVCVEAGEVSRPLVGVPFRVENNFECYVLLYHGKVQDVETNKLEAEQYAEAIAAHFDTNKTLELLGDGGIVIHGHIVSINHGYSVKQGSLVKASRLTWQGKTKTMLGA